MIMTGHCDNCQQYYGVKVKSLNEWHDTPQHKCKEIGKYTDSITWSELSELTHATQVHQFNWCLCEEQEQYPYADCPREVSK